MSAVIKYRDPRRPDEAGMVLICGWLQVIEIEERLKQNGFIIVEDDGDDPAIAASVAAAAFRP
jgi:hypothetical protein